MRVIGVKYEWERLDRGKKGIDGFRECRVLKGFREGRRGLREG